MPCKAEIYQLAAALSALLGGLILYLFARPAESIYLFALFSYSHFPDYNLLGVFGQWLPSLVHTYAFILLTVIAVGNGPRIIFISSLFWVGVSWIFELGQHPAISARLMKHIPPWFSEIPFLENSANYFQRGTFDPLDLFATLIGAFAAWLTYQITRRRSHNDETE